MNEGTEPANPTTTTVPVTTTTTVPVTTTTAPPATTTPEPVTTTTAPPVTTTTIPVTTTIAPPVDNTPPPADAQASQVALVQLDAPTGERPAAKVAGAINDRAHVMFRPIFSMLDVAGSDPIVRFTSNGTPVTIE